MIKFFKRWWLARAKKKHLANCERDGHLLNRVGELSPGTSIGAVTGPAEFWLFACKCGYGEIEVVGKKSPYRRSWEAGEAFKKQGAPLEQRKIESDL